MIKPNENLFQLSHFNFLFQYKVNLLLAVFQNSQFLLVRQKIEHLAGIDLEEAGRNDQIQRPIFGHFEAFEHVFGNHGVDALLAVLRLAVEIAAHCMGLAAAGLTVCEARGHATLEDRLYQWLGRVLIDYFVITRLVERIIESEDLILEIFGKIDFRLRLVYHHLIFAGHADHVDLFARVLLFIKWTFPYAHGDLMILHGVGLSQRPEFYAVLIFPRN